MKHSFKLKDPKSENETLIYFRAYFKTLNKDFIYSTGEKIHPELWDFKNYQPILAKSKKCDIEILKHIKRELARYSDLFNKLDRHHKLNNEELTIERLKAEFDQEFKVKSKVSNDFFRIYDLFLISKETDLSNGSNNLETIKRYGYNKTLLLEYEKYSKAKIRFTNINLDFYNSFVSYCVNQKEHSQNTLRRNIGLLVTFLNWSVDNKHSFDKSFKKFPIIPRSTNVDGSVDEKDSINYMKSVWG